MKITKLKKNTLHLAEVLGEITEIIFCEDVTHFPREPFDVRYEPEDPEYTEEISAAYLAKTLVTCGDDQLKTMDDDEIHNVKDGELLHRLYNLYPNKLTPEQITLLRQFYEDFRFVVDKSDVEVFLVKLKKCKDVRYDKKHEKTNNFILDNGKQIRKSDCLKIINSLTISDYTYDMYSVHPKRFGDDLMVFQPHTVWKDINGQVFENLCVYIKLDIDRTSNTTCAIISFHKAEHMNQTYPYKE